MIFVALPVSLDLTIEKTGLFPVPVKYSVIIPIREPQKGPKWMVKKKGILPAVPAKIPPSILIEPM